jgi:hypothetical protein
MSLGIYPVFDPNLIGTKFEALGEVLFSNFEALDRIANAAKLKKLTTFTDTREVPADFDGPPDDLEDILGPWTDWFDPAEGRSTIQALALHIKSNPKVAKKLIQPAGVIEELLEMVRVLVIAENEGVRFRLQVS